MPPKKAPAPKARPAPVRATGPKSTAKKVGTPAAKAGTGATAGKTTGTATGKKPVAGAKAKAKGAEAPKKVEKKWTKEDDAARKIQTECRRFLAKRELAKKKRERAEYEKAMEDLEKEAYAKVVRMEQERAEQQRQKEDEERKRKREANKRRKRMLEAAFDGDNNDIKAILKEVAALDDKNDVGHDVIGKALRNKHQLEMIDCEDANKNTPLSEAASGGNADTCKFLMEHGANPNSQGLFLRTPLYRASFAGHLECCQLLLKYGADPRIYAEDAQTPENIATLEPVRRLFEDWDISLTERLLQKLETDKEKRREEEQNRRDAEMSKLEERVDYAQSEYRAWQKRVMCCAEDLNKRIEEHDKAVASGFEKPEITLQAIHDAEAELEIASLDLEKSREKLASLKMDYREQQKDNAEASGLELPGLLVNIRELDDVLLRDVGDRIKDSGRWPLIIDSSGQTSTFLRYRDTNYINSLNPQNMQTERLRLALLGSLRYGKPLVLDMMEVDMFDTVAVVMDRIQKGLLGAIMDKRILLESVYSSLIEETDGPDYNKNNFNDLRLNRFMFVMITKNPFPPEELIEQTYPIRVHVTL